MQRSSSSLASSAIAANASAYAIGGVNVGAIVRELAPGARAEAFLGSFRRCRCGVPKTGLITLRRLSSSAPSSSARRAAMRVLLAAAAGSPPFSKRRAISAASPSELLRIEFSPVHGQLGGCAFQHRCRRRRIFEDRLLHELMREGITENPPTARLPNDSPVEQFLDGSKHRRIVPARDVANDRDGEAFPDERRDLRDRMRLFGKRGDPGVPDERR